MLINNVEVNLTSRNGSVFATSLDVAKVFEKEHKNILRDIANMSERARLNFELKSYTSLNNKKLPLYEMNRDGFSFLVMSFTGHKADDWKLDFIDAFNKMENIIRNQQQSLFNIPTYPEALRLAADQQEQLEAQKKIIEYQKPRVEFANRLQKAEGTLCLRDFAKVLYDKGLQIGQNRLFDRLRELRVLDCKNKPYQRYVDMGIMTLKEATYKNPSTNDDVIYSQVRVTAKGQEYLYNKLVNFEEAA